MNNRWRGAIFCTVFAIATACLFSFSERFQQCVKHDKNEKPYSALHEEPSFFSHSWLRVRLNAACVSGDTDVFVALSGIAVAFFTFTLWQSTHLLFKAGEHQAVLAQDMATKIQRAFVYPKEVVWAAHWSEEAKAVWWSFRIIWKNSGATPTQNLKVWTQRYLEPVQMPSQFGFVPNKGRTIPTLLGPGADMHGDRITILGHELAKTMIEENTLPHPDWALHFYIWGWATYRDVFEGTGDHITRFCYKVKFLGEPTELPSPTNICEFIFAHHPQHNCADDECKERDGVSPKTTI